MNGIKKHIGEVAACKFNHSAGVDILRAIFLRRCKYAAQLERALRPSQILRRMAARRHSMPSARLRRPRGRVQCVLQAAEAVLRLAGDSTVGHLIDHASLILACGGPASGPVASGYVFGALRASDGSDLTRWK